MSIDREVREKAREIYSGAPPLNELICYALALVGALLVLCFVLVICSSLRGVIQ